MTTHVLNSAMMPAEGYYHLQRITKHEFAHNIYEAFFDNKIQSWIGYEQNLDVIEQIAHVRLQLCRELTKIDHGDRLLMMRLKYRPEQKAKGYRVDAEDFEYFRAYYINQPPVPSWNDLMSIDMYEPAGQTYLENIYRLQGGDMLTLQAARQLMKDSDKHDDWIKAELIYLRVLRMVLDFKGLQQEDQA
jgi:hypothetical protein